MFHEVANASELSAAELRGRYDGQLAAVVDEHGVESVAEASGVERERIEAIAAGDSPDLTLEEAGAMLGMSPEEPDAEAIVVETRDHLLMGMTTGVLDVEAVESGVEGAIDAREIQQKIEGRLEMTLDELAQLHSYIDGRAR
jgi:hypothetical protein